MKRALLIIVIVLLLLSVILTACGSGSVAGEYSRSPYSLVLTDNGNFYFKFLSDKVIYQGQWEKQGDNLYFNFVNDGNNKTVTGAIREGNIIINPQGGYYNLTGTFKKG